MERGFRCLRQQWFPLSTTVGRGLGGGAILFLSRTCYPISPLASLSADGEGANMPALLVDAGMQKCFDKAVNVAIEIAQGIARFGIGAVIFHEGIGMEGDGANL